MFFKRKEKDMVGMYDKNQDPEAPHQLNIWITIGDRDALYEMAMDDDRSMSSLMRQIIRREVKNYLKRKGIE